ncbi:hypothetical protein FRB94_002432 [Tulasnella sp. JGI-2019a]|nr:hypothetical protein FRB94_002432 [Tulasnella sp. JGI-2019a]KAG9012785.1 hypothetical protein FRB93_001339 [Tulasnella sp. JGI-2019a]
MAEEQRPLLNGSAYDTGVPAYRTSKAKKILASAVVVTFITGLIVVMTQWSRVANSGDPLDIANRVLSRKGVIDGHIDLPWLVRALYRNNATTVDLQHRTLGHVDLPRLKAGKTAGFFWSAFTPCPDYDGDDKDFVDPNWSVRDTLEQIDIAKQLIEKYPDFQLATTQVEFEEALDTGRIASLIGVEGAHQLGNSLGVLRMYHALGVRYMTLTHICHNAFADSGGYLKPFPPNHYGLSDFGRVLIKEMNRLGVIVDLSHTSDETARQAFELSEAPVIWSHSSARAVWNVARNVPDDILSMIAASKKDAVVMVNFSPAFVAAKGNATIEAVADHVEHIAKVAGKKHVGIGSDFDGIESVPVGLEDVSKYPNLFAELYRRGWKTKDLEGLAGGNVLRVYKGAERVSKAIQARGVAPYADIYRARKDL